MGDNMMSRRSIISRAALGATAVAVMGGNAIANEVRGKIAVQASEISNPLARLIAKCERAEADVDRYHKDVFNPARERLLAAKEAVPHIEFEGPAHYDGGPSTWSTEQEGRVRYAKWAVRQFKEGSEPSGESALEAHKADRKLVAAVLRREREFDRIKRRLNFEPIYEEAIRLENHFFAAIDAVTACPVASLADLTAKLDFMVKHGEFENDGTPDIIRRDVSSLHNGEA